MGKPNKINLLDGEKNVVNPATEETQLAVVEEISNKDLMVAIRTLLQTIAYPPHLDKSANQIRAQVTGSVTATVSSTTAAISTVDSYQGKLLITGTNINAWANACRRLIS